MKSRFSYEPMYQILDILTQHLKTTANDTIEFEVLNPDISSTAYTGDIIDINEDKYIYRPIRSWIDLAQNLNCRALMPQVIDENFIKIKYKKLNQEDSFHKEKIEESEKYGTSSTFFNIKKNEEPSFIHYYKQALKNSYLYKRKTILNLGVNNGSEFEVIEYLSDDIEQKELLGIDYCASIIKEAQSRFKQENINFLQGDINKLDELGLKKHDLIVSIGTLQSSNINFKKVFMDTVQNYLNKDGAIVLGFPNCRWIDKEMVYGAKAKNYSFPEASLLHKDIYFCKKYLQQKKFRVTITGKDYIFLTATSIN